MLLGIKNGQSITDGTPFDGEYGFDKVKDRSSDHRLLLGTGFIKSKGKFTFTRYGNSIEVTGVVGQKISDPFDFHSGKKFEFQKYGFKEVVESDEMIWLAKYGKAKPFEVRSVWRRKFTWRLRIVRDPATGAKRIVGVGKPQWTDAK